MQDVHSLFELQRHGSPTLKTNATPVPSDPGPYTIQLKDSDVHMSINGDFWNVERVARTRH